MSSHAKRLRKQSTIHVLYLWGADENGDLLYAYVGITEDKLDDFLKAQKEPNFDPQKHGAIILARGEGHPDEKTRTRMEDDYGFDHSFYKTTPDVRDLMQE